MRLLSFACALILIGTPTFAQNSSTQTQDQGADPTQSLVSPLGLGTGATLAVTSKGTSVNAAIERQLISPTINFWQVGFSGTLDKNGQTEVFSSSEADAPGFKGKVGLGRSSFIKARPIYTRTGSDFLLQTWCRDVLSVTNKSLPSPAKIPKSAPCAKAVSLVQTAFATTPPSDSDAKKTVQNILDKLSTVADNLTLESQFNVCTDLNKTSVYQFCPDSGKPYKSVEDQRRSYPELYAHIVTGQPGEFQWKLWGSWAPNYMSVNYRSVTNGIADLATKREWSQLLNAGIGDIALYFGRLALGLEGGFGQTVHVTTQNVCNNTSVGSFTAQQCDTAMIGKPNPMNAWTGSGTFDVDPIPLLGTGTLFNPGAQVVFTYTAPTGGGHSSELAFPIYLAPTAAPIKLVFGLKPMWDWNTDPKIGNKFSIAVFVGARPEVTK